MLQDHKVLLWVTIGRQLAPCTDDFSIFMAMGHQLRGIVVLDLPFVKLYYASGVVESLYCLSPG